MATAQEFETITMPEGGLGSFFTSNLDEIDDNVLMFGREGGINSIKEVADRMAQMGRQGDSFVVHASEKEVMVPREVAENNPELVGQIKQAIAAEGADPEAYVVGSDRNSINPYTGQREFFLKKMVKGIKNFFKKSAKIILPIALNYFLPGLGTIASGAIGAGIGGLIQGESVGDAFKSALTGGFTAGMLSGVSGALSAGPGQSMSQGFMTGLKGGLPASFQGTFESAIPSASDFSLREAGQPVGTGTGYASTEGYADMVAQQAAPPSITDLSPDQLQYVTNLQGQVPNLTQDQLVSAAVQNVPAQGDLLKTAVKYGLPTLGVAAATGAFDPIPANPVDLSNVVAGTDLSGSLADASQMVADSPELYRIGVPSSPTFVTPEDVMNRYVAQAAAGGPMTVDRQGQRNMALEDFPRRTGQIQGPGTETSDDIPAMLSDGEFVMTARAVRGAGNGSREHGFKKMYDIMRAFEGGAVA